MLDNRTTYKPVTDKRKNLTKRVETYLQIKETAGPQKKRQFDGSWIQEIKALQLDASLLLRSTKDPQSPTANSKWSLHFTWKHSNNSVPLMTNLETAASAHLCTTHRDFCSVWNERKWPKRYFSKKLVKLKRWRVAGLFRIKWSARYLTVVPKELLRVYKAFVKQYPATVGNLFLRIRCSLKMNSRFKSRAVVDGTGKVFCSYSPCNRHLESASSFAQHPNWKYAQNNNLFTVPYQWIKEKFISFQTSQNFPNLTLSWASNREIRRRQSWMIPSAIFFLHSKRTPLTDKIYLEE